MKFSVVLTDICLRECLLQILEASIAVEWSARNYVVVMTQLQGRGSGSSHNELGGQAEVRSQHCGSLLTLKGNSDWANVELR